MRRPWKWSINLLLVCLIVAGVYLPFFLRDRSAMGDGSPEYAETWKAAFEQIPDPETAQQRHPEVVVKRFANGEWAFGVSLDSHTHRAGGTIVIKDSRGRV